MNIFINDLKRLDFEKYIWFVFAILAFLNIFGDNLQKEFLKTNDKVFEKRASSVYIFVLIVVFIIYIYFFYRNYRSFVEVGEKEKGLFLVRLLGSALLIGGVICLIYFQINKVDSIGTPEL